MGSTSWAHDEAVVIRTARFRFPIWALMLLVAAVAIGITVPLIWVSMLILAPLGIAYVGSQHLIATANVHLAKWIWLGLALGLNGLYIAATLSPIGLVAQPLMLLGYFSVLLPLTLGFGGTWAALVGRHGGPSRHGPSPAWFLVMLLAIAPMVTLVTLWPLHMTFLLAKPAMDRMADRAVAAGARGLSLPPTWIGPFHIVATKTDPHEDGVALLTDSHPGGPAGFVRLPRLSPDVPGRPAIILGDWINVPLWGRWSYRMED
ncbi:hypothetical protein [Aquisphaera insulae]|uniref:hypothetical protein n=1 Tax=Aquisphaera insulae TaxID=2712864 RepID=UPI0013EB41AE|nr:hypothetical protein [Aquisphaera insulae]